MTTWIEIKKIHPDAILPKYAHKGDSGMDLYSIIDHTLKPFERIAVPTGLELAIPEGYEGQVRPKSGLALRYGLTMPNSPGTIDSGYRGEIMVGIINLGEKDYILEKGHKVAQMVIQKKEIVSIEEVKELSKSHRGENGFGSSGK